MKTLRIATLLLGILVLVGISPSETHAESPQAFELGDLFAHLPPNAMRHQPVRVLVVLHGVGMRGDTFAQPLMEAADRNGWILVAPTIRYRNWMDAAALWEDDLKYSRMLNATLDTLANRTGLRAQRRVFVYGFSRGAQLAHRFALLYPDRVQAVAAISAGSYTLPTENQMPLPLGVANLGSADWTRFKNISFWIAVGEQDSRIGDVPRAFDGHGRTRVERARAFHAALKTMGMDAEFAAFPGADHEITPEMQAHAMKFLRERADRLPRAVQPVKFVTNPPAIKRDASGLWMPALNTRWQWQLDTPVDPSVDAQMYDIDLFDNDASVVAALHTQGRKAVCYISMGSWEDWRPDASQFPAQVIGKDYRDWHGEKWLDIRQVDLLAPIMQSRLDQCKAKGFDAVEPDNIDGYDSDTGFPLTYADQLRYNIWLANQAHARGLSIGLKNDAAQVADLLPYFDWALTEDCFAQGWCGEAFLFVLSGKPVFAAEYTDTGMTTDKFCAQANAMNFNGILKHRNLDAWRETCR